MSNNRYNLYFFLFREDINPGYIHVCRVAISQHNTVRKHLVNQLPKCILLQRYPSVLLLAKKERAFIPLKDARQDLRGLVFTRIRL